MKKAGRNEPENKTTKGLLGLSRETEELLRIVTDALRPFPEARAAVVSALKRERA